MLLAGWACATSSDRNAAGPGGKVWKVGFAQFGSESQWRIAVSSSVQRAFLQDPSVELIYSDAQQSQDRQLDALRSFIARKVNVILLTAVAERGYRPVLEEARKAGIPVIVIDRDVAREDRPLRLALMGSSFVEEGEKAARWLAGYLQRKGIDDGARPIRIVELQGDLRTFAANDRMNGFRSQVAQHPNWQITHSQPGNWYSAGGKKVMAAFLESDRDIQVVYAHNDQMALGAIQAIKEAGLRPGKDITVVSIDGVKGALQAIASGELNCSVECSPYLGPQVLQAVRELRAGKPLPPVIWTDERVFDETNASEELPRSEY
jgi:simple sugar transport system substrate-binding protein